MSTKVEFCGSLVTIELHGVLNPMDKLLVAYGRGDVVQEYRKAVLEVQMDAWRDEFLQRIGVQVGRVETSLNLERDVRTLYLHIDGWAMTKRS